VTHRAARLAQLAVAKAVSDERHDACVRATDFSGSSTRSTLGRGAGVPGFIALHGLEAELSALLGGRRVDLVTERFLNRRIRERVLAGAEVQYAAGS
jgi:hypothetical protein